MGLLSGVVADGMLRLFAPPGTTGSATIDAWDRDALDTLLGADIWERVRGRSVLDFGCGMGADTVALARAGAREAIGLDIRESCLQRGRALAERHGVTDRCRFVAHWEQPVELILSIDAFEHFADPALVLQSMTRALDIGGRVLISFGPTWLHPHGGHLFSVFPWSHLLFSEAAQLRWRARYRDDGARGFSEVEGGLNQMTIARFERLVAASPLRLERLQTVPIRRLRHVHARWNREFTTALVRAELCRRD